MGIGAIGILKVEEAKQKYREEVAAVHVGTRHQVKDIEQFDSASDAANKLLRTYVLQMEAMATLRCGGKQTVQVKHVHVYPGGQAVAGNIMNGLRAGRGE